MKILAFFSPALINLCLGVVLFFFLLIGLNGYSEKQAFPGLILFIVWVLLASLFCGGLSLLTTNFLNAKKSWSLTKAGLISAALFTVAGAVLSFAGILAAILLIEALR